MIRFILKIPVVLLFCASVFAQTATVNKKTLDAGSPNLFFENLSLALNEKSGQTMLTWEKHPGNHPGHSTLLMKLNSAGKVRGAEEILIQGTNTYDPGIVYNKNKNEFALVYADEGNGSLHAIYIQALDPAGQKQGSPVRVSTDTGPSFVNQAPDFTYDPIARVYVVVWIRNSITPGTPGEGIFGAILDEDFQTIAGPRLIQGPKKADPSAPRFPQIADVAVMSTGKFVIGLIDFLSITPLRVNYSVVAGNIDLTNLSKFKLKNGRSEVLIPDIKFVQFASALNAY